MTSIGDSGWRLRLTKGTSRFFSSPRSGLWLCSLGMLLFVCANIVPVWSEYFFLGGGELPHITRFAISAQRELTQGHFFLRFANDFDVALQPLFLLYTPVFHSALGLLLLLGLDGSRAILIFTVTIAASTTFGIYATARLLGADRVAAGLVAATLPFSPYFLTDVFSRGALAELSAWAVFPWVIFFFVRMCEKPAFLNCLPFILSFAFMTLCHKIFAPWTVVWLALFGILLYRPHRSLRLAPAFALSVACALALVSPYWANAMLLGDSLSIVGELKEILWWKLTATYHVFMASSWTFRPIRGNYLNHFHTQLGPVIVFLMVVSWFFIHDTKVRALAILLSIIMVFVLSFFGLLGLWSFVPRFLLIIQYPYRLLLFAVTFGLIGAALTLTHIRRKSVEAAALIYCTLAVALLIGFWWPAPLTSVSSNLAALASKNYGNPDYHELKNSTTIDAERLPRSLFYANGNIVTATLQSPETKVVKLPVQYSRFIQVTLNGTRTEAGNTQGLIFLTIPAGTSSLVISRDDPVGIAVALLSGAAVLLVLWWMTGRKFRPDEIKRFFPGKKPSLDGAYERTIDK